jgi:phage host-nuclease inhibitor protein Gam
MGMPIPRHVQKTIKSMGNAQIESKIKEGEMILDLGKMATKAARDNPEELKSIEKSSDDVQSLVDFLKDELKERGEIKKD